MKVLLIDDHPLILSALASVIEGLNEAASVVGAQSAGAAREILRADPDFDLVLLDLNLGDADGFDVLVEFRAAYPALPVVVVSASDRHSDVIRAVDAGAMGFVPKRASYDMLYEALRMVMSGGIFVPKMLLGKEPTPLLPAAAVDEPAYDGVAEQAQASGFQSHAAALAELGLTPRQTDVLALLLKGLPNKLIARELNLSVETVKDHVAAVLRALGVSSRTQAVLAVGADVGSGRPFGVAQADTLTLPRAAHGVPAAADAVTARYAEVVRSLYEYMPVVLAGYAAGVGVVWMLYWHLAPMHVVAPWLAAFAVMFAVRWLITLRFRRAAPATPEQWRAWGLRSNIGTLVAAALWGATGWVFYGQGEGSEAALLRQNGLIVIVYTFCVVGIPVLSTQPWLYLAFGGLCLVPLVVRIALVGDLFHYQLAAELVLIITLTIALANSYRQALQRAIDLKVQADALAAQLRVETGIAQAARREAETANRAKTQFFTAASHDLRQPLHAMGLFAEALRQRVHQPEVAQLVNSINESVDALEGLFSELLDITRIDSGGVDVHDEHFAVGDILRKLRLHFEPAAFEKGLALRLRGGARVVFADPLLVERILRNLVSNAIRYTDDGSVLVGCRQRGGRVWVQVWDTGVGIREAEQARIFDEFYQVPNTGRVSPEQRKGLGLGLAIVKRLADLMGAPLTVCSQPGRGTVFTLDLPAGKAPREAAVTVPRPGPTGLTLDGRTIVIVEDEPAVRAGLDVLLRGWGAHVESFDSFAASRDWALARAPSLAPPDLLIVDYRLEEGRTGLDAILALRARLGSGVPAILVTGSTMTGHDREAQEHDFHLLIKPVVPNKLRAMIAFKLGAKAGRAEG